ncbi:MAG: PEGA domain-containing protein, partial [Thermodesulfobacteriota bacterium]
ISKAVGAASSPLTQAGILLGTPSYMSPEQIAGTEINGRSDLFSLGIIFYQLLTGEKPFVGDTIPTLLYNIVNKDPTPPGQIDSTIPPHYDEIVAKALAKNPDKRYRRAKDFVEDLKRAYRGEALMEAPSIEPTMTVSHGVAEKIYPKRKRYGLLTGIAILLLALVLGGYYWLHRTRGLSKQEEVAEMRVEERVTPPIEEGPVEPIPLPTPVGTIVVSSIPSGASVFLDGAEHSELTPTVIQKVTAGEKHEIKVEREGFKPWTGVVEPEDDKPLSIEASLERLVGTIIVRSTPPGGSVFVDNSKKSSGSTPMELPEISADDAHKITVMKKGYEAGVQTVTLRADERKEVEVTLKPLFGEIRISSDPSGAKVYLNEKYMDRDTPTRLSGLSVGKRYKLRLKKKGYKVWEDEVSLTDPKPLDLPVVTLQQAFGRLNLLVSPWADVYYLGRKLGTTPMANIRFQEGTHKLILKNPLLNIEKEITVKIVANELKKKSVDIREK